MKIVIIGSGNVAYALAEGFSRAGVPPVQVWSRSRGSAARVAGVCGCDFAGEGEPLCKADLYILAVSDKAVRNLSGRFDFGEGVVAHTAGSVEINAVQARHKAVFYPLQTISRGRTVDFRNVPIFIEASDARALSVVKEAAEMLSRRVMEVDSAQRTLLHVAAVFASNFTNHMYAAAEELAHDAGFDFEILKPLIAETAAKALDARSPREVQTGPAVRNDFETRSRHTELLSLKPYLQNLYINISKNIWEISKKT